MSTLLELTAQIVAKHAAKTSMTQEQLLQDMHLIHEALRIMEQGSSPERQAELSGEATAPPILTIKQAFKKNEVVCMICGKGGFKVLTRHLTTAHNLKPGQYRQQFKIPSKQKLAAKSYSEERRQSALDRGMVDVLARAREKRMANIAAEKGVVAVRVKAPAPAKRVKPDVPVLLKKSPVPATKVKAAVPEKAKKQKTATK